MTKINTIEELEAQHYGTTKGYVTKADTFAQTTTSGYYNAIYGALAWANLNLEANAFSALPKYVWTRSGVRIITSRPTVGTTNANTVLGGTAEAGKIMETVIPGVEEFAVKPKVAQLAFGASTVHEWLATNAKDDLWGSMSALRPYMARQHAEYLNQMILADVEGAAAGAGANFAGSKDWETLDRIISSDAEEDEIGGATYAGWYDPWNALDRDASTKYDATVQAVGGGTIGGDHVAISKDDIVDIMAVAREKGGNDVDFMLGSHLIYKELQGLFEGQMRFPSGVGESILQLDVGGVKTFTGRGVGIHIITLYGIPFIVSKDAPKYKLASETANFEIGRVLGCDTTDREGFGIPRLGIRLAIPTSYNEVGRGNPAWPFVNDRFTERGVYWTTGEVVCTRFNSQFKLRDAKV